MQPTLRKFLRFGVAGGLLLALCVFFNVLLVTRLSVPKVWAYAVVLVVQTGLGYVLNRCYVYSVRTSSLPTTFARFAFAVLALRVADWLVFSLQVVWLSMPYIVAQVINAVAFFLVKFFVFGWIFEGRGDASAEESA